MGEVGNMKSSEASVSQNAASYQTFSTPQAQYNLSQTDDTGGFATEGPRESNFKYTVQEKTTEPQNRSYESSRVNSPTGQNKETPTEMPRNRNWSKATRVAGVGAGVLAGGLLSGAVMGNVTPGMAAGGKFGVKASEYINRGIFTTGENYTLQQIKQEQKAQDHSKYHNASNSNYKSTTHNYSNMNQASTTQINMQDLIRQYHSKGGGINGYEWRR